MTNSLAALVPAMNYFLLSALDGRLGDRPKRPHISGLIPRRVTRAHIPPLVPAFRRDLALLPMRGIQDHGHAYNLLISHEAFLGPASCPFVPSSVQGRARV